VRSLAMRHADTDTGFVTFSLGVACLTASQQLNSADMVRQADVALYRAKRAGRNCVELATESDTSIEGCRTPVA
jgi:diguanylate cyclase (GGDEF)-like protein